MQKFGLDSLRSDKYSSLESEIAKEKATTLGRAGKRLQQAIDHYYADIDGAGESQRQSLVEAVTDAVWALILQREFSGFCHQNLEWITEHYDVPQEAISRLGKQPHK
ncbi:MULTISPECIES: DUF6665 family protein [Ferrimonas]|uniref:DUF6665 family protein n=1 Tax=Ferrimonas TaxID=44011 RepID=UPI000427E3F8|nr:MULTISPECIES: DUF6665 family protein [Ferrimonas]USD39291.1 hypothetical protein J8Z22_09405 [Ferrimonas sp. SCSIO 43195]